VRTEFDPALSPIPGDHDQLVQAFVGLIINARQALEHQHGARTLHVRSQRKDAAVRITIADNGPGMAADVRARAFEPFFTTRSFGEGGGSGLAIARGVFEGHGGAITIDDAVKEGCAIVVTLPIDQFAPAGKGEA
jgi:signal transduction histidine kinase